MRIIIYINTSLKNLYENTINYINNYYKYNHRNPERHEYFY